MEHAEVLQPHNIDNIGRVISPTVYPFWSRPESTNPEVSNFMSGVHHCGIEISLRKYQFETDMFCLRLISLISVISVVCLVMYP